MNWESLIGKKRNEHGRWCNHMGCWWPAIGPTYMQLSQISCCIYTTDKHPRTRNQWHKQKGKKNESKPGAVFKFYSIVGRHHYLHLHLLLLANRGARGERHIILDAICMEVNLWFLFGSKRGIRKCGQAVDQSGCQGVHSEDKPGDSILVTMQTGPIVYPERMATFHFNLFQAFFLSGGPSLMRHSRGLCSARTRVWSSLKHSHARSTVAKESVFAR